MVKMETLNNQKTNEENFGNKQNSKEISIQNFFTTSLIFITGATGFLGKALLEKLLRSCSEISAIYILIRAKKDLSIEDRFQTLLKSSVFDRIRSECPSLFSKIIAIKGDMNEPNFGLSQEDYTILIENVNIIFHVAATVRFDEPLKVAVNLNTCGTQRLIDLASNMKNLISIVHVSTAYSNADKAEIKEIIYKNELKPETAIDICENFDDDTLKILEAQLQNKHPNTYTLTKGLAEDIIMRNTNELPISIVRPSIVGAAYQEPFPGWVDNVFGITGIMMEISRGTIRSIFCNDKFVVDIIPVDYVVNTIIIAAWRTALLGKNNIKVYNCVSGTFNPIKWETFGKLLNKYSIESPSMYTVWYPGLIFTRNRLMYKIMSILFHFLPAFFMDLMLRLRNRKPIMMKIMRRTERVMKKGTFFAINEWHFHGENMKQLTTNVKAAKDADNFNIDIATLDWDIYVKQYLLGIRKYILNDCPDTLQNARRQILKFYWIQRLMLTIIIIIIAMIIFQW